MHIDTHFKHQIKESRVVTYFVVTYRVPGSSIGDSPSTIPTAGCICATLSSFSVSKQGPPTSLRSVTATMPDAIVHAPPNRCKLMIHRVLKKKTKYCPKISGKKRKAVRKWRNKMCGILSRNEAFEVVSVRTQNPNRNRRSRIGKKLPKGLRGIRVWNMADMDIFRAILLVDCKILGAMINTWTGTPHYIL